MPSELPDGHFVTTREDIPYIELPAIRESWQRDNQVVTRRLACLWDDRSAFQLAILGEDSFSSGSGTITRDIPQEDPEYKYFFAESMDLVTPGGTPVQHDTYDTIKYVDMNPADRSNDTDGLAIYDVTFRLTPYDILPDDEISTEFDRYNYRMGEDSVEGLPLPSGFLVEKGTQNQYGQYDLLFPKETIIYKWFRIPTGAYPENRIKSILGKVNKIEFEGFAKHTVLFVAPRRTYYIGSNGQLYIDADLMFEYRPSGWNKLPNANGTFVEYVRTNDPTIGIYEEANLYDIWDLSIG